MTSGNPPTSPERQPYRTVVSGLAGLVILVAGLVLVGGWGLDVAVLRSVIPGAVGMKALTAVGLLSGAAALLLLANTAAPPRQLAAGRALAGLPALLGLVVMGEYVLDVDVGVDELFFVDREGRANGIAHPGRFAPTTGVCFLLTTTALLLLDVRGKRGWRPSEAAALPVAVISGMAILGYAYSLPAFYGPSSAAKMAVHTAGCFAALMGAIALARPHGRVLRLATTTDPGGVMVRRLVLVAVSVPLVLGWLHLRTVERGLLEPEAAAWWLSAVTMFALVVIIAWCATVMSRADGHRRRLEEEMKVARDQAVEASLSKSSFVANMSHEIRTPLNGVIGMTELLLQTPLNDEQREYGQAVRSSGDALMAVIGDILDFSKIEAGKLELDPSDFRLGELVGSTCSVVAGQALAKGVALRTVLDEDLPQEVRGDAVRVRQVLLNLMSNALKFTTEGEVVLEVSSRGGADQARHICFAVSDTGIGIAPVSLDTVFESFAQAESTTTRNYGGTGLGLAISKQLVELMHGEIGATSVVGAGSRFWFTVPLASASEAVAPPAEPAPAAPDFVLATRTGRTVLVAEDNEINQLVVRRMLEKLGYEPDLARNGREAVDKHTRAPYAAILMDCEMPELNGYDATREIRSLEAEGRHTPIIAMTAHTSRQSLETCLGVGMDDHIGKPLRSETLKAVLDRALAAPQPRTSSRADAATAT